MHDTDQIEAALDELRPSFDSDGFSLRQGTDRPDGTVVIELVASPQACLDCLVPDDLLVGMLTNLIQAKDTTVDAVALEKVGFDAVEAH